MYIWIQHLQAIVDLTGLDIFANTLTLHLFYNKIFITYVLPKSCEVLVSGYARKLFKYPTSLLLFVCCSVLPLFALNSSILLSMTETKEETAASWCGRHLWAMIATVANFSLSSVTTQVCVKQEHKQGEKDSLCIMTNN